MVAKAAELQQVLAWLPCAGTTLPPRLNASELLELSPDPLVEIGAQGWSHRALWALSVQEQAPVMVGCDPMALPRMQVQDRTGKEFKAKMRVVLHD